MAAPSHSWVGPRAPDTRRVAAHGWAEGLSTPRATRSIREITPKKSRGRGSWGAAILSLFRERPLGADGRRRSRDGPGAGRMVATHEARGSIGRFLSAR